MKYYHLYIIIGLVLVFQACDKDVVTDDQMSKFVKLFGSGLEDAGVSVMTTETGYFVVGNLETENSAQDICLIPTDKFGNTSGSIITFGGDFDDVAHAVVENDSGYIIVGATQQFANSDKDAYLIQIDKNGNELWSEVSGLLGNDEAYDVIVLEDGSISLSGYIEDESGDRDILFVNYNRETGTKFSKRYGLSSVDEEGYSLAHLSGNFYLVGGYKEETTDGQKSNRLLLLRWNVNSSGVEIGDDNIPVDNTIVRDITTGSDGNILVACERLNENNESEVILIKMNNEVSKSEWTSTIGERLNNTACCLRTMGNSIFISGTATNSTETSPDDSRIIGDMMIAKVDMSGGNPEYFYCGDGESYTGAGFDFTSDNGFIITGANFVNEKSLISIFKIDPSSTF